ncbi:MULTISPECIES: outer membrane lipid asymmetry maintenance protein MlaD [unclassified Methylophilus]|jgi:phospholipid/cholesterol/gamma-HCH transport system substrate-binding protein|uniref:outer membrane lipid asymmetry maintenance protein MlaD n=1 Tax=unclassified Methylophilus TaxID=2630143 RepID=UPI000700FF9B|nr:MULTISPECIES: outer membrane lipid asymmetry maintenance protein MlaD [unclassified Methylophilus]KQT36820.1 outer membrane lipid asymmetry maintenance protein MlaD [Methylophilus sp. Leaf414]KQT41090.1 outer membrane lipid asymmetry maintenance protein MlaD [Methylophilus sp. Leaf416]KQT58300.1 outer membrane lipid asymmetry maintenance protein MlaD [Methylophilus sp. Leaf459]
MEKTTIDLWVGIFVAMGFAALLGLAMKVGNLTTTNIGETYMVTANFENIGGLKPRAPIKSAGVVVGRVEGIKLDPKTYEAVVSLNIDKRFSFPKDTFANIYTAGLLGEQYVGLEAGGDENSLKNGDKIIQTQDAVVLEKLISQFLYSKATENDDKPANTAATSTETGADALDASPLDKIGK